MTSRVVADLRGRPIRQVADRRTLFVHRFQSRFDWLTLRLGNDRSLTSPTQNLMDAQSRSSTSPRCFHTSEIQQLSQIRSHVCNELCLTCTGWASPPMQKSISSSLSWTLLADLHFDLGRYSLRNVLPVRSWARNACLRARLRNKQSNQS